MSEIAVSLKDVSKCYKRYEHPVDRLKEIILPWKTRANDFWALQNINLEIPQGETLGIIGQNGAGKSTLLQIIAQTVTPTTGEVRVNGRVGALLELGSGFNPEFTGRENVFFNGQILGLTRQQIEAKFEQIASFADIGDFLDQPIKTYSSGMVVRLAFAVVAHIEPTILIVDEALAVGDAKFQARCMQRIRKLKDQGVTILFVSHDCSSVKMLCQRALLMDHGKMLEIGNPNDVVNHFIALLSIDPNQNQEETKQDTEQQIASDTSTNTETEVTDSVSILDQELLPNEPELLDDNPPILDEAKINPETNPYLLKLEEAAKCYFSEKPLHRHGNKQAIIESVKVTDLRNREINQNLQKLETGSTFKIIVSIKSYANLTDLVVGISLRNLMGVVIYGTNTLIKNCVIPPINKGEDLQVEFHLPCHLNRGVYTVTVGAHSSQGISYDWLDEVLVLEVINPEFCDGLIDLDAKIKVEQYQSVII